ncbi:hypothetical protein ACN28I_01240 [Archangium gephyra]|uniref:hypothetical protein n=1 Tax=Archangium gephyra TaxID=48 RepID=UPI003B81DA85
MTPFLSAPSRLSLLLLLLLAPGVGLASPRATPPAPSAGTSWEARPLAAPSGLPGTAARAPLRLSGDDSSSLETKPPPPSRGLRILAETGAGLLTGTASGAAGLVLGYQLCQKGFFGPTSGWLSCIGEAVLTAFATSSIGFGLGVWWGGQLAGGKGKLLGLLAGWGVGALAGLLLSLPLERPISVSSILFAVTGSMIGSIVGYELSQRSPEPGLQAMASPRPRLQPMLAFSPHGAVVGLGGSF